MEELEKIKAWLVTYPKWEGELFVDYTKAEPGHFGLYPLGVQVLHRQEDVLGNRFARLRSTYQLRRVITGHADGTVNAGWLLDFAQWVQSQSEMGLAPQLGTVSQTQTFRAEKGRLQKADQVGTAVYSIDLVAEYTKIYPET